MMDSIESIDACKNSFFRLGLSDRTFSANIVLVKSALIVFGRWDSAPKVSV
jgi:hypothetical protein